MIFLMRLVVSGHSMEPTFKPGQSLLVSAVPYIFRKPKTGDVVVIKDPRDGRLLLKRIKKIRVYSSSERSESRSSRQARTIRVEEFFVSGDNPAASTDSKTFGTISQKMILGRTLS